MSVILDVAPVGLLIPATVGLASGTVLVYDLLVNTQFSIQVKTNESSQLINGISSVLQKLLKYFNSTTILTSSFSKLIPTFPVILVL